MQFRAFLRSLLSISFLLSSIYIGGECGFAAYFVVPHSLRDARNKQQTTSSTSSHSHTIFSLLRTTPRTSNLSKLSPGCSISTPTPHCSIDASWPLQNRTSNLKLVTLPLARISIHTFLAPMVASSLAASHTSVRALLPFPSLALLQHLLSWSRLRLLQLYRLHTPTTCTLNSQVFLRLLQFKKCTLYQHRSYIHQYLFTFNC